MRCSKLCLHIRCYAWFASNPLYSQPFTIHLLHTEIFAGFPYKFLDYIYHIDPKWVVNMRRNFYKDFKSCIRYVLDVLLISVDLTYHLYTTQSLSLTYEERWRQLHQSPDFTNNIIHTYKVTVLSSMLLNFMYLYSFSVDVFLNIMVSSI